VDKYSLATKKTERLWRSEAPYYEYPLFIMDAEKGIVMTRREANYEQPNYFKRNLHTGKLTAVTNFPNPYESMKGVSKELIKFEREDGVDMTGTLYLPAGYDKEKDGPLPMFMWAYPREYKSADAASQVTTSPHAFIRTNYLSPILWVAQGYAVFNNVSMPVIGEGDEEPNETFVEQLRLNAEAAVNKAVEMGVADKDRIAIGGHSYGAFMTGNLLAHSDLFAAGIARSGAYNRTLTPFGFQAEERTYWEAPSVYFNMSPFNFADKIKEPILLIHGEADNNSGTYPMQSERMYAALKGHGATVRLVMLPAESHGYRARESVMHMAWEMDEWLEKYVKNRNVAEDKP
jgi:dipeptidyl aminopeptidase/acylaminoacyl peptidase